LWKLGTEKIPKYKKKMSAKRNFPVVKTDEEWREELDANEYTVLREKGTELAGTGEYDKFFPKKHEGHFCCRGCGQPLYSADSKFNSGCGWPAFDKCYKGALVTEVDGSLGMRRIEIMCSGCGGHLGHVFEGERFTETNERHCVNSLSIKFVKDGESLQKEQERIVSTL
jgi:peptide-methionine (R)-S-oxide reductase